MCLRSRSGDVVIRNYYNDVGGNVPSIRPDQNLRDKQWQSTADGRVACRFSRQMKVDGSDSVDLSNSWYQLYAWGDVSEC